MILTLKKMLFVPFCMCLSSTFAQVNPTAVEEKNMKTMAAIADTGWVSGGTVSLTSNLNYLSQWAAGGQSSLAANALLNYTINYRQGKDAWDNQILANFGGLMQPLNQAAFKTDDLLDVTSKYGRKLKSDRWFMAVLGNFKTQFAPGYTFINGRPNMNNKISEFMAPAWALISVGLDYKPNNKLTAFISPITYRAVIVMDDSLASIGAFGVQREVIENGVVVTPFNNIRSEMGAYARVNYNTLLRETLTWNTTLELFSNYRDRPENIDISWQSLFTWKLKKLLSLTVFTHLIYDDNTTLVRNADDPLNPDLGPGIQLKSIIGLGVTIPLK
jgi:hypothetical protein